MGGGGNFIAFVTRIKDAIVKEFLVGAQGNRVWCVELNRNLMETLSRINLDHNVIDKPIWKWNSFGVFFMKSYYDYLGIMEESY